MLDCGDEADASCILVSSVSISSMFALVKLLLLLFVCSDPG